MKKIQIPHWLIYESSFFSGEFSAKKEEVYVHGEAILTTGLWRGN